MVGGKEMFAKVKITGKICVKTGLHIGAGNSIAAIGAVDAPVIRDVLTQSPMLPGSSLKGKMRTLLAKQYNDGIKSCDDDEERIIRLFGTSQKDSKGMIKGGRLLFSDMIMDNQKELEAKGAISDTEIKFENTINRFTAVANPRQIERVISGAVFPLEIIYNMDDDKMEEDFQILKDAFILLQYDYLGGHGSRGYGRVEVQALDIQVCVGTVEDKLLETCRNLLKEV